MLTPFLKLLKVLSPHKKDTVPAATYSPTPERSSTMGLGELNDRVRDGNGCDLSSIVTRTVPSLYVSVYCIQRTVYSFLLLSVNCWLYTIILVSEKYTSRVILLSGPFVKKLIEMRDLKKTDEGKQILEMIEFINDHSNEMSLGWDDSG